MNPVTIILLLTVVGAFSAHALTTKNAGDKTEIKILNLVGIKTVGTEFEIILDVAADNYSQKNITITDPIIKVFFGNSSPVATSNPSDKKYTIEKKKRKPLQLRIRVPFISLPVLFGAIFNKKVSEKQIKFEVSTKANGLPTKSEKSYPINDLVKLFKK
jgi:hypothetical protein